MSNEESKDATCYYEEVDVSKQYETAIILVLAYHSIDCVRNLLALTFFMSSVAKSKVEQLYNMTSVNACFGIAVLVYLHAARFSESGNFCSSVIPERSTLLSAYIAAYWSILGA